MSNYLGIVNLGNTCYMNSFLQALHHTTDFRQGILDIELNTLLTNLRQSNKSSNIQLIIQLQKLFALMCFSKRQSISPHTFKLALPGEFRNSYAQQDANEFGKVLLEQIEDTLKAVQSKNLVKESFMGTIEWKIECQQCHAIVTTQEDLLDLSLSFPNVMYITLNDLIQHNCKVEVLDGDNKYFCKNCNALTIAHRSSKITKTASNLIISLNRFQYSNQRSKLFTQVNIPNQITIDCDLYLNAVIIHQGQSLDFGHYYTYSRFYRLDDQSVTQQNDIQQALASLSTQSTPYILFYKRQFKTKQPIINNIHIKNYIEQDNAEYVKQQATQQFQQYQYNNMNQYQNEDDNDESGGQQGNNTVNRMIF